jgi:septal ring factor EnvC (AmiA/AmiB activator)
MAKKFKINDGATKYVETATLLEPANNNSASQNEKDEIREVSQQLAQIKKKHDEAKKLGNKKEDELAKVKKEIDQLYVQEVSAEGPTHQVKGKIEMLEESLGETNYKTDE